MISITGRLAALLRAWRPPAKTKPSLLANADIHEIEQRFRTDGSVKVRVSECEIAFDLSFVHERRYLARWLTGLPYPQHDIDELLFQHFIRPGDVILDVGANIGVTAALALAFGATRVHCVEPEASLAARLRQIADDRIIVHQCAAGEMVGTAELHLSDLHNQGHTLDSRTKALFPHLFGVRRQTVPVKRLPDILGSERCDVWKLDVEGGEAQVIRGAISLLSNARRPRVVLAELIRLLRGGCLSFAQAMV
jgi:FkbM family methyltransferase